jgi:hypothetical protein
MSLNGFLLRPNGNGRKKQRTVVTAHARVAPHDPEKEEKAHFIKPTLSTGGINLFSSAAIRALS